MPSFDGVMHPRFQDLPDGLSGGGSMPSLRAPQKGTWVRLFHLSVEGKLIRGFEGLDVGDRVRVELIGTDVERGFIDFARARRGQGGCQALSKYLLTYS